MLSGQLSVRFVIVCIVLYFLLAMAFGASPATIRYVHGDSSCPGDGSDQAPYCSIQASVDQAQCGDVIRLRPTMQPYTEQVTITGPSCPASTPVFLEPERQHEIAWQPRRTPRNDVYGLSLVDVDGWVVRGLTFLGSPEQPRNAIQIRALTRSVSHTALLGNRVTDWNLETRYSNSTALVLGGNYQAGHGLYGMRVEGNTIQGFRSRGLVISHSNSGLIARNTLSGGRCGPSTPGGTQQQHLVGAWTHTGDYLSVAQARGDVWEHNRIHDFQTIEDCLAETGGTNATVHAFWCDSGPSDGVFAHNDIWNIARTSQGHRVRVARWEARCHRWQVRDNHLWDNGGWGLTANGINFDVTFAGNLIERPASVCVVLGGGGANSPARRRTVQGNTCVAPGQMPFWKSPGAEAQSEGDVILGNSW